MALHIIIYECNNHDFRSLLFSFELYNYIINLNYTPYYNSYILSHFTSVGLIESQGNQNNGCNYYLNVSCIIVIKCCV